MVKRRIQVIDPATGDLLFHYEVPAERYVDVLKAVDGVMEAADALGERP